MAENTGRFRKKRVNFSMVSNEIIRDNTISLRAKGLYAMIQSYITLERFVLYKGFLQKNSAEGERAFDSAWKELKEKGYLVQYKLKDESNKYYYEYELLDSPAPRNVGMDFPHPHFEGLQIEAVQSEEVQNAGVNNNTLNSNTLHSNTESNHIVSEADVMRQIGYECSQGDSIIENIISLMTEIMNMDDDDIIRVNQTNMRAKQVKDRFKKIEFKHMDYITLVLKDYSGDIRNIRAFMITTIFNAPSTCDLFFQAKVNHDLYGK